MECNWGRKVNTCNLFKKLFMKTVNMYMSHILFYLITYYFTNYLDLKTLCHLFLELFLKAKRHAAIRGNPTIIVQFCLILLYQFSETSIESVWQQMARI